MKIHSIRIWFQEASSCDGEIDDLRSHQVDLSSQLEQKQVNVQQLQGTSDTMDGDIERLVEVKQKVCKCLHFTCPKGQLQTRGQGHISCYCGFETANLSANYYPLLFTPFLSVQFRYAEFKFRIIFMPPFEEGGAYCVAHVGRYVGIP